MKELYRLEKDNNKMLHSMRRNAILGGLIKFVFFLALLGVPVWFYFTYLSPVVQQLEETVSSVTGTKLQIEGQFAEWGGAWEAFRAKFTGATSTPNQ